MRIEKIEVKNLFGIFNHMVPLNKDDRITIIHGPNGYGKTVLLTSLNALFTARYHVLRHTPFDELAVGLDDGRTLRVVKETQRELQLEAVDRRETKESSKLMIQILEADSGVRQYAPIPVIKEDRDFPFSIIERAIPQLERVNYENWVYIPTRERLSLEEVVERFEDRLPIALSRTKEKEPKWLTDIRAAIDIRFIESQRLLVFSYPRRGRDYDERQSPLLAVDSYTKEIATSIQTKLGEYAALSQSLDRTFPTRLVKFTGESGLTIGQLRSRLAELEEKRTRLMAAGFLDKEKEVDLHDLQSIDETNRNVLSVYVEDVKQKLNVFDELTNKIDLLVRIINNRFLYKRLRINKKDGFVLETSNGKNLSPSQLSSGEQHELVLFYELLFRVKPNSLILIDEPELSLHVVWQQQFLRDLQEIARLGSFDVLIATHSPQIIHDRWDLTVELKGPVYETVPQR